jgi:hypothetical protein
VSIACIVADGSPASAIHELADSMNAATAVEARP